MSRTPSPSDPYVVKSPEFTPRDIPPPTRETGLPPGEKPRPLPRPMERILVVKLGALGDFVLALGPMQAIRRHAPNAHITLLTTPPFADPAHASGWFQEVRTDGRPRKPMDYLKLRKALLHARYDMVFDLQTSDRSALTWRMLWPHRPPMSGIVAGCSHPQDNPNRTRMHTIERHRDQLARCGIKDVPLPELNWMDAPLDRFDLPERIALIIPGGAPHRPDKRWPAENYAEVAVRLSARGISPVLIGTPPDGDALDPVRAAGAIDLSGRTSLLELAALARRAECAVGNDTGPMHLAAMAGCRSVALFSNASNPAKHGQRGPSVDLLHAADLDDLPVDAVWERLEARLGT